jgi:hypothetical protein
MSTRSDRSVNINSAFPHGKRFKDFFHHHGIVHSSHSSPALKLPAGY